MLVRLTPLFLLLLGSLVCERVNAHNGSLALAAPVVDIELDGDLSDWPAEMQWGEIATLGAGEMARNKRDFKGRFAVGYSVPENALFVAVEVEDQSLVADPGPIQELPESTVPWDKMDGCEIYLDIDHAVEGAAAVQCALYGNQQTIRLLDGGIVGDWKGIRVEAVRSEGKQVYEWRLDVGELGAGAADGLANADIYALLQDGEGCLWLGTGAGAIRYDGRDFTRFTREEGLAGDMVRSIHQDREGNLWFGTDRHGVSRYDGEEFVNFNRKDGLPDGQVFSIEGRRGTV